MIVEKQMECRLAGETEVLGENLPHHKIPYDQTRILNPGRRCGKPATNCLSYGAALLSHSIGIDQSMGYGLYGWDSILGSSEYFSILHSVQTDSGAQTSLLSNR
jgi:hypothetical protein